MSTIGFHHLVQRLGKAAKMPFPLHPHMLRHACGYKLANDGHDTRALQHYLGHKNIQHTVRYTELSPERFVTSVAGTAPAGLNIVGSAYFKPMRSRKERHLNSETFAAPPTPRCGE
jgi:hypothetical protein